MEQLDAIGKIKEAITEGETDADLNRAILRYKILQFMQNATAAPFFSS